MAFSEILRAKNLVDATGDANVAGMPGFRRGLLHESHRISTQLRYSWRCSFSFRFAYTIAIDACKQNGGLRVNRVEDPLRGHTYFHLLGAKACCVLQRSDSDGTAKVVERIHLIFVDPFCRG